MHVCLLGRINVTCGKFCPKDFLLACTQPLWEWRRKPQTIIHIQLSCVLTSAAKCEECQFRHFKDFLLLHDTQSVALITPRASLFIEFSWRGMQNHEFVLPKGSIFVFLSDDTRWCFYYILWSLHHLYSFHSFSCRSQRHADIKYCTLHSIFHPPIWSTRFPDLKWFPWWNTLLPRVFSINKVFTGSFSSSNGPTKKKYPGVTPLRLENKTGRGYMWYLAERQWEKTASRK